MKARTLAWTLAALCAVSAAARAATKEGTDVPAGYRTIALPFPGYEIAFLKKGDHVDVMVTFEALMADKSKEKVTATIVQNVPVLAVRQPKELGEKGAVELMLNKNEAQYAALAVIQGELQLAVRPEGDKEMTPMEMASFRKLFR